MGAIKIDQDSSLEITYGGQECPFTGLDASAAPQYINSGGLNVGTLNCLTLNNSLTLIDFSPAETLTLSATQIFIGIGDLNGVMFAIFYDTSNNTLYIEYDTTPTALEPTWSGAFDILLPFMANSPFPVVGSLTYKNVNSVTYFSFANCPYILQWDGQTLGILTNWLGCAFLNEFNGRLVAANIYQIAQAQPNNTYAPSPANTSATSSGNGSATSTAMVFPSEVIGAGASLQLTVNYNASVVINPPGANSASIAVQYSTDGGTTWTTLASYTGIRSSFSSGNLQRVITLPYVANADAIQIQTVVTTALFSGSVTATCAVSSASLQVTNTPIQPVFTEYPYQFAWSAGLEQYGIWNTLNSAGLVTGAGYENIPDVEDYITGLFMVGPTAFVLRQQGITEVTALSNGTNPFDFNHMWASHQGIGTNYSQAAAQYGSAGFIPANDDIYTLGYSGINVVGGVAKSQIYADLINAQGVIYGGAGFLSIDGEISPVYLLAFGYPGNVNGDNICYLYIQNNNAWYAFKLPPNYWPVQVTPINNQNATPRARGLNGFAIVCANSTNNNIYLLNFYTSSGTFATGATINLKGEEVLIYRDITIDAIIINAVLFNLYSTQQITFSVNGTVIGTLNSTNITSSPNPQYIVITGGVFTGKTPQLTITLTGGNVLEGGQIKFNKIVMFGSIDNQRPI